MHCLICAAIMLSRNRQTSEGENGALVITYWRCQPCDQAYEEIRASKGYQGMQSQRLLYPVRSVERAASVVMRRSNNTRRNQTHGVMGGQDSPTLA
jgi:hypothetical protein